MVYAHVKESVQLDEAFTAGGKSDRKTNINHSHDRVTSKEVYIVAKYQLSTITKVSNGLFLPMMLKLQNNCTINSP